LIEHHTPHSPRESQPSQAPIPHWPGEIVNVAGGSRLFVRHVPEFTHATPVQETPAGNGNGRGDEGGRVRAEPALCVHGLGGSSRNWTDLMDVLRPRLVAAALDLPGYGESPPRPDGKYSITAMAKTVTELIEALGNGPVHLIGNSMGGAVAVRAAAKRPDLVRSLTLVSPALPDSKPRMDLLRFPVVSIPKLGEHLVGKYLAFPVEQRVADTLQTIYHDVSQVGPERFAIEVAAEAARDSMPYATKALIGSMRALTAEQLFRHGPRSPWREAATIQVPVLAIYGTGDKLVRAQMASRARRTFLNGQTVTLKDTGHVAMMERPATVAGLIGQMLDGNDRHPAAVDADERTAGKPTRVKSR